ncbi:MAG: hypothetical protein EOP83_23590 [Verrucomicrobiaceae bacterium]|nr:MAG: hypothetical protein EOP83_23590 [Verrucomicrobiaceae bacterium]
MILEAANIPVLFATVVARASAKASALHGTDPVTFAHGSYDAVKAFVGTKEDSLTNRGSFPMIWLITPVEQTLATGDGVCDLANVQVLFLAATTPDRTEDQQVSEVIGAILRPIYLEFLQALSDSYLFSLLSAEAIPHRIKEWTYRSVGDGGNNLFDKPLCAIQVQGLRLTVNESVPYDFKMSIHN